MTLQKSEQRKGFFFSVGFKHYDEDGFERERSNAISGTKLTTAIEWF